MWSQKTPMVERKRSLPLLSLLGIQKGSWLQHYLAQIRSPLNSFDLPSLSEGLTWTVHAVTTLFIRRPHIVSPSVSPFTTTHVQALGSHWLWWKGSCWMTVPTLVTLAPAAETVCKFHNTEQGQGSFGFLPQIFYPMKVKCPHEGSQPGLAFCS